MSSTSTIHDAATPISTPSLERARLYLCTDARTKQGDFEQFLRAAYAGGVDIIQLRDKSIEAAQELELLAVLRSVAEEFGKLWAVNDRADIAALSGAPVFHVGQKDLPLPAARALVGPAVSLGLSSHDTVQVSAAAASPDADYFVWGRCGPPPPSRAGPPSDFPWWSMRPPCAPPSRGSPSAELTLPTWTRSWRPGRRALWWSGP